MLFIMPKLEQVMKMWKRFELVFDLKNPLHIGYLPSGGSVLAPTRYYVPGKNFWGALTQRITEVLFNTPVSKDYRRIGQSLKENFRFSYFFVFDGEEVYLPCYREKGLYYGTIEEQKFQYKFIRSRVLTEIDSSTGAAKDETLHEIEFINGKFIDNRGSIKNTSIIGMVWIREIERFYEDKELLINNDGVYIGKINIFEELTIGGERNIGFGRIVLNSINKGRKYYPDVDDAVDIQEVKIKINNETSIISHIPYNEQLGFSGDIELLSGRQYYKAGNKTKTKEKKQYEKPGEYIIFPESYFAPGTVIYLESKTDLDYILGWDGILRNITV